MSWVVLIAAGLFEVVWAIALKMSNGFANIKADILFMIGMALSVGLLSLAMKSIPMGTAYAAWTGIGAVGGVAAGLIFFGGICFDIAARLGCADNYRHSRPETHDEIAIMNNIQQKRMPRE